MTGIGGDRGLGGGSRALPREVLEKMSLFWHI